MGSDSSKPRTVSIPIQGMKETMLGSGVLVRTSTSGGVSETTTLTLRKGTFHLRYEQKRGVGHDPDALLVEVVGTCREKGHSVQLDAQKVHYHMHYGRFGDSELKEDVAVTGADETQYGLTFSFEAPQTNDDSVGIRIVNESSITVNVPVTDTSTERKK